MEHAVNHNARLDEMEAAAPSPDLSRDDAAPVKPVFKPLFFGVLALSLVLAGACCWLASQQQAPARTRDSARTPKNKGLKTGLTGAASSRERSGDGAAASISSRRAL